MSDQGQKPNGTERITTSHQEIRDWAELREGKPGIRSGDSRKELLIYFPGDSAADLEPLSWEDFFAAFDRRELAFGYEEEATRENRRWRLIGANLEDATETPDSELEDEHTWVITGDENEQDNVT